jgi:glycosyltransferase involved in cell wall biosynthesis
MMRVFLAHPGLQHAHQLAWALHEGGHLLAFWSGVPVADSSNPAAGWGRWARGLRAIPVPGNVRKHPVIFPLLRRLGDRLATLRLANSVTHRLERRFDRWVARHVARLKPAVVVAYENAALHTFRAARDIGAVCVLDAASVHYREAAKWLSDTGATDPDWVHRRKQDEIDCADAILTCSPLAAETYTANGVTPAKVFACPLGTELPALAGRRGLGPEGCRFVFVGMVGRLKGIDLLLDAFASLQRDGERATLSLIGSVVEPDLAARARSIPGVKHWPILPRDQLFSVMAQHDCLVLPSRIDSFGMVVPEGMAVGMPAILSCRVGAKCIVERHPGAGWIVPFDTGALRHQMLQVVRNKQLLADASKAALVAARDYSWEGYRRRVVDILCGVYAAARSRRIGE